MKLPLGITSKKPAARGRRRVTPSATLRWLVREPGPGAGAGARAASACCRETPKRCPERAVAI